MSKNNETGIVITYEQACEAMDILGGVMAAVGIAESEGMMTEQGFEDAKNKAFMDLMETLNVCGVKVLPIIDGDFIEVGAD